MLNNQPARSFVRSSVSYVLMLIVALLLTSPVLADEPDPRTDALGDPLPAGARLRLGTLRFRHPSPVDEIALSPNEKSIVSLDRSHLIVWDTATGKERWRADPQRHQMDVPGASYGIRALAFAADSSRFYATDGYSKIVIWDTETGEVETVNLVGRKNAGVLMGPASRTKSVDVTRDGKTFAIGGAAGVSVCDDTGRVAFEIANKAARQQVDVDAMNRDRLTFGGQYSYCRFSPDENILAVVTSDSPSEIRLVHVESAKEIRRITLTDRLVRLAFTPDSQQIVATERDVAVRAYAVDTGQEIWTCKIVPKTTAESYTSAIAVSPDAKTIAACAPIGSDYTIRLLDPLTGKETGKLTGHKWKPWAVTFTADSQTLYSSGWDGALRRWDVAARKQMPLPVGVRGSSVVAAAANGDVMCYCDDTNTVRLVDTENGEELRTFSLPGADYESLTFSSDSKYLAGGGNVEDKVHVAVWDATNARLIHRWEWPRGRDPHSGVECLKFSPNGKRLAAAVFRQDAVYLWDLDTGRQVAQLPHKDVYGLSFSPDNATLATAGWDKMIRFWAGDSGELDREFEAMDNVRQGRLDLRMYTVRYSPKGDLIATAHLDGMVRVWNAADMTLRKRFKNNGGFIYGSICFSTDGSWLATGSTGGTVTVWDPKLAVALCKVGKHQSYIYEVCWPNDQTMLTGGRDGVAYAWDLDSEHDDDLEQLWTDLSGDDDRVAFCAMCKLAAAPDKAITLLAQKIDPTDTDASLQAQQRAVSLLARLGTPRARLLLRGWTSAKPDSRLAILASEFSDAE